MDEEAAGRAAALLEAAEAESYARFETDDGWRVETYHEGPPTTAMIDDFRVLVGRAGGDVSSVAVERVPDIDWSADNRRAFAPIAIGRYVIHGPNGGSAVRSGRIGLEIAAGQAFGTGRHASTALCLEAVGRLAKRLRPRRVLDLGCGAGTLAIAAAKTWPAAEIMAADIDPIAVAVAAQNARINRVDARILVLPSDGFRAVTGHFDLILANILAAPLCRLSVDLAARLQPAGLAVLSGIMEGEAAAVLARYRASGLYLRDRAARDGWVGLLLGRRT